MTGAEDNKRVITRSPVLRAAKIHVLHSVFDCLILDLSETGIRVSTDGLVLFPDEVVIELRSGALWSAARRWQRGVESGFELLQFRGLSGDAPIRASSIYASFRTMGLPETLDRLAREDYFDNPALKQAAIGMADAYRRLSDVFQKTLINRDLG